MKPETSSLAEFSQFNVTGLGVSLAPSRGSIVHKLLMTSKVTTHNK